MIGLRGTRKGAIARQDRRSHSFQIILNGHRQTLIARLHLFTGRFFEGDRTRRLYSINNWLKNFCSYAPDRLKGVGAINLHAPESIVDELHRIVDFGWKALFLRPNLVKGRLLSDSAYEPFWTECDQLKIAVDITKELTVVWQAELEYYFSR
ncbi:MAG: amidohydrolase family protein [Nostoc sp.]